MALVEHALQFVDAVAVGRSIQIVLHPREERCRRQLLLVAHYHQRPASTDRSDRVPHRHLRRFVEHDDVKRLQSTSEHLRHRHRTHQQTWREQRQ